VNFYDLSEMRALKTKHYTDSGRRIHFVQKNSKGPKGSPPNRGAGNPIYPLSFGGHTPVACQTKADRVSMPNLFAGCASFRPRVLCGKKSSLFSQPCARAKKPLTSVFRVLKWSQYWRREYFFFSIAPSNSVALAPFALILTTIFIRHSQFFSRLNRRLTVLADP